MEPTDILAAIMAPAWQRPAAAEPAPGTAPLTDFGRWQTAFRLAARADEYAALGSALQRFGLDVEPADMVEGTIDFVAACIALANLDGLPLSPFVNWQLYRPTTASGAVYTVTFDVFRRGAARLVAGPGLQGIDLADLYGMPWQRHERLGYERFWIERIDGAAMSRAELGRLERRVGDDLRFDYAEDEVDFRFDAESVDGAVAVEVHDHPAD